MHNVIVYQFGENVKELFVVVTSSILLNYFYRSFSVSVAFVMLLVYCFYYTNLNLCYSNNVEKNYISIYAVFEKENQYSVAKIIKVDLKSHALYRF